MLHAYSMPGSQPPRETRATLLERARRHCAAKAWETAYHELDRADAEQPLDIEDLNRLSHCAALTARDPEFIRTLERLHQLHADRGDCRSAARVAFWLSFRLRGLGEAGRANGWLGRAQRLLERQEAPCPEAGYLEVATATRELVGGSPDAAFATAARALELGFEFGDRDLVALAQNLQGRAALRAGRVADGLALLDESMLGITNDELTPMLVGLMYCWTIDGCHRVYALDRAREWTRALSDWCATQPELVTFTGTCTVHRSEILQLGGDWEHAIEEARRVAEWPPEDRHPELVRGEAAYQQAEIHRLRGESAQAEDAYRCATQRGRDPQPGLALLRLAQGRADTAENALRRVLMELHDPLRRACYLPAWVEVLIERGRLEEAEPACAELDRVAAGVATPVAQAMAAQARGALLLAQGHADAALEPLRFAFARWSQVGAPYLAARLRVLLARACLQLGDTEGAALENSVARETFERLGALSDLQGLNHGAAATQRARHGLTAREIEVLRLVASGKTNKVIAQQLSLSEKTVDRHMSNIFTKIGVCSRAAATAFAYEQELV
jgi:DNA-binding NarL/FixJ family response regulator